MYSCLHVKYLIFFLSGFSRNFSKSAKPKISLKSFPFGSDLLRADSKTEGYGSADSRHSLANATNNGVDEDDNDHDNNSIKFNGYLLTCRLNSTSAYYKASTATNKPQKLCKYAKTKH
jgi:hypothetical protein